MYMNLETVVFEKLFVVTSNEHRLRAQRVLPQLPKRKLLDPKPKAAVGDRAPDIYRFLHTLHVTPLPTKWVRSIGCWGQVLSLQEIIGLCEVDLSAAKSLRYRYDLKTCSPSEGRSPRRRPQVDVAMDCWVDWRLSAKENPRQEVQRWARKAGVLPIEFCLYNLFVDTVLGDVIISPTAAPEELWHQHISAVEAEWPKYQALLLAAVTKYDAA